MMIKTSVIQIYGSAGCHTIICHTHPYGQWKDTGIRLEGEAVRSLTVTFLEMWNAVSDKDKNDSDFTEFLVQTDYQAKQTGFIQPYADSPMDHEQVGEEVYISMVNKAEKYCWFMTPYLIYTSSPTCSWSIGLSA